MEKWSSEDLMNFPDLEETLQELAKENRAQWVDMFQERINDDVFRRALDFEEVMKRELR